MQLEIDMIVKKLRSDGIVVIKNFYNDDFCKNAIIEIEQGIIKYKDKITISKGENTGGDFRLYGIDKAYKNARLFSENSFFTEIINQVSKRKEKPFFVIGGKLEFFKNSIQNSGGGWHRDKDEDQFKVMLYLNSVTSENGPFMFIKDSKILDAKRLNNREKQSLLITIKKLFKGYKLNNPRYSDESISNYILKNKLKVLEIHGEAGDVVIFNSSYLHRGKNILNSQRYTLTSYFFPDTIKQKQSIIKSFGSYLIS